MILNRLFLAIILLISMQAVSASDLVSQELTGYPDERSVPDTFTSRWVEPQDGLNLRSKPGTDSKVITLLPIGTRVEIIEKKQPEITISGTQGYWFRVKTSVGEGWCFSGFLRTYDTNQVAFNEENIIGTWMQPEGMKLEFTAGKDYYTSLLPLQAGKWSFDPGTGINITTLYKNLPGTGDVSARIESLSTNKLVIMILGMRINLFRLKTSQLNKTFDNTLAN